MRAHFLGHRPHLSLCPHMAEGARGFSEFSLLSALIPFLRTPLSRPNHQAKAPTFNTMTWHLDLTYECGGGGTQTFSPWHHLMITGWRDNQAKSKESQMLNIFWVKCLLTKIGANIGISSFHRTLTASSLLCTSSQGTLSHGFHNHIPL